MEKSGILPRKSKIIATIGPATSDEDTILELLKSGVDVFRLNFSHSTPDTHLKILRKIRKLEETTGKYIPVIQDLPGPKIRIGKVPDDSLELKKGDTLYLSSSEGNSKSIISVLFPDFDKMVKPGEKIFLGDGEIELEVLEIGTNVRTLVRRGGILRSGKGITLSEPVYLPSLTDRDREYLEIGVKNGFDYIALSYVQRPDDVREAKELVREIGGNQGVIAKIEKCEALEHLDEITKIADGLIVARGDLGVVLPLVKIPHEQQRIIKTAREFAKPVFVATQMLSSMVEHERPTRAEVTDVTQAVVDGADGILLSEETAIGRYPVETISWADKILREAENIRELPGFSPNENDVSEVISYHAVEIAKRLGIRYIVTPTYSGSTPRRISKFRPDVPIIAMVPDVQIARKLSLLYGVVSVVQRINDINEMESRTRRILSMDKTVKEDDFIMFLWGYPFDRAGITNSIAISKVSDLRMHNVQV